MSRKVIVDTSIWIEYFKNTLTDIQYIENGLSDGFVHITGPVISELLQGAKTQQDYDMLSKCIGAVPYLECCYEDWINAGRISFQLRKEGKTIPLTDIVIAIVAIRNKAQIYTLDHYFNEIPGVELFRKIVKNYNSK